MCIIHALAVDYDYCCQGLGKMLVNHIISDAKERGSEAIHLDAIDNNDLVIRWNHRKNKWNTDRLTVI